MFEIKGKGHVVMPYPRVKKLLGKGYQAVKDMQDTWCAGYVEEYKCHVHIRYRKHSKVWVAWEHVDDRP